MTEQQHVNRIVDRLRDWKGALHFYEGGKPVVRRGDALASDLGRAVALLRSEGLAQGARVGILGPNCYSWVLLDLACIALGLSSVGIDPSATNKLAKLDAYLALAKVYDLTNEAEFLAALQRGSAAPSSPPFEPHRFGSNEALGLKFTSGSTGELKAIELRRKSVDDTLTNVQRMFAHGPADKLLVFLPLYLFQQRFWIYSAILFDHDAVVVPYRLSVMALQRERPTVVMGVPEFFESLAKGIEARNQAALSRLRESLGGKIRYLWTGSAPISRTTLEVYAQADLPLYQGYGMNETCIVAKNYPGHNRLGSVGQVLPTKRVLLDEQNQILVRSECEVSDCYLNLSATESALTFRPDGYVATGDTGTIDDDGYLYVTGRLKDIIVLSSGRKVAPVPIEKRLEAADGVERAVVFGSGRHFLSALISPTSPAVTRTELELAVQRMNAGAPDDERIRKFFVAPEPLTRESGLLTSQFKIRRTAVWEKYEAELARLYDA